MREHESLEFLKAVRIFDPEQLPFLSKKIEDCSILEELNRPNTKEEFKKYLKCNIVEDCSKGLIEFWKSLGKSFPNLTKLVLKYLTTPVSSVDVERSFSMYRDVLTNKKCSLKESSIETLCMINFNANFNLKNG